ncbi:ROK family protein [Thermogemmatispora carboxidivorans]|uniref:ROK family protein n=1 Tax=Thermogemmatispora carboxidivorans TaxID=1382306 RepID=UPI00069B6B24|nr:ROK family protein [Thermogemmatispora carboxidivorans]
MVQELSAAVGVEIGSSRATIAIISADGQVWERFEARTLRGRPARATLEPYLRAIDAALQRAAGAGYVLRGIGLALPGKLDQTYRRPFLIPLLPSLNHFPLSDLLETRYHLPVRLHSDVDAAALGEYAFGAARSRRRALLLTVQAVVGAALISDGQPEPTARDCTGHVCHLPVANNGPRCSCGRRGCISTLVSLEALQRLIQRAARKGEPSGLIQRLSNREQFSAQLLAEEATRGDGLARALYQEVGHWLGVAVAHYVRHFAPEVVVVGNGLLNADELLLSHLRHSLLSQFGGQLTADESQCVQALSIVPAHLGRDAALIGSAVPFLAPLPASQAEGALPAPSSQQLSALASAGGAVREELAAGRRRNVRLYRHPPASDDLSRSLAERPLSPGPHPPDDIGPAAPSHLRLNPRRLRGRDR